MLNHILVRCNQKGRFKGFVCDVGDKLYIIFSIPLDILNFALLFIILIPLGLYLYSNYYFMLRKVGAFD